MKIKLKMAKNTHFLSETIVDATTQKSFPGHAGRPGQQGGSLPRKFSDLPHTVPPNKIYAPYVNVYHGTSAEFVRDIIKHGGLKALPGNSLGYGRGRKDSVYFTTDEGSAQAYGLGSAMQHLGYYAVVQFSLPPEEESNAIFDEIDSSEFGLETSWRIEKDVPLKWMDSITLYNDEDKQVGYIPIIDGKVGTVATSLLKKYTAKEFADKKCYATIVFEAQT